MINIDFSFYLEKFNFKDKVKNLACQGFGCRMSDLCYDLSDLLHVGPQITPQYAPLRDRQINKMND